MFLFVSLVFLFFSIHLVAVVFHALLLLLLLLALESFLLQDLVQQLVKLLRRHGVVAAAARCWSATLDHLLVLAARLVFGDGVQIAKAVGNAVFVQAEAVREASSTGRLLLLLLLFRVRVFAFSVLAKAFVQARHVPGRRRQGGAGTPVVERRRRRRQEEVARGADAKRKHGSIIPYAVVTETFWVANESKLCANTACLHWCCPKRKV